MAQIKPWETEYGNFSYLTKAEAGAAMRAVVQMIEDQNPRGYWTQKPMVLKTFPRQIRWTYGWYGIFVRDPDAQTFFEMTAGIEVSRA